MVIQTTSLQPGHPPRLLLNAFVQPRGLLGRIGGVLMARSLSQQQEIADPGTELCEVGCGPGVLAALLAQRHPQLHLHLVDPSPVMRSQAGRRCQTWHRDGRIDVSVGTSDQIPLSDESCDTVLAVNSVAMWPNLSSGLHEIHRVLRPGGHIVLSWHGATGPSSTQRRLALPDVAINTLTNALRTTFDNVQQHDLIHSTTWQAERRHRSSTDLGSSSGSVTSKPTGDCENSGAPVVCTKPFKVCVHG
jgi:SAM-dependent methyltransferase